MAGKQCGKCTKAVSRKNGNWMACDGFCSAMFHLECISMCESDLPTCATRNILWFCDECLPKLWEIKNRYTAEPECSANPLISATEIEPIETQIAQLKTDIININETLQQMINRPSTPVDESKSPNTFSSQHASHPSRLLCGTNDSSPSFSGCITSSPSSRRFWMYFTRIACHASEDDIRNLVRDSLHFDGEITVRKLVPPWKDASTMDYISFKVGITHELKDMAMQTSTWPKGLRFRPFMNAKNSVWEPRPV